MATKHKWLKDRKIVSAWMVYRIDDYGSVPAARGQLYHQPRGDDKDKAIWTTEAKARAAAEWAAKNFGHEYGIFKLTTIVARKEQPIVYTKV